MTTTANTTNERALVSVTDDGIADAYCEGLYGHDGYTPFGAPGCANPGFPFYR